MGAFAAPSMPGRDRSVVDGDISCPSVGNSDGRPWGDQMTVPGEFCWPPMGSFAWPPSTTPSACTQKRPGPTSVVCHRSPRARARASGRVKAHDGGDRQANSALVAHRHGAHRPRSRDPALLRAPGQRRQDQARGHPHLEALRRPRGLSLPALAAKSPGWGSGSPTSVGLRADFPAICRPSAPGNDLENV